MIKILFTAILTYIATSIDEIPVLFMLYTRTSNKRKAKIITLSYYIGTILLISLGVVGALGLNQIPQKWMVGISGLIPLFMGIKILATGEDEDEEKTIKRSENFHVLAVQVIAITIGLGVDDVGVYMPLFSTLTWSENFLMIIVFLISTGALCYLSYKLAEIEKLKVFIEKYERFLVGAVFTCIGIFVMYNCGTIEKIMELL